LFPSNFVCRLMDCFACGVFFITYQHNILHKFQYPGVEDQGGDGVPQQGHRGEGLQLIPEQN